MAKANQKTIKWLPNVEDHDYPAAESFLALLYSQRQAAQMITRFRRAAIVKFKAKDIFRASQLPVLRSSNLHVKKDLKKIRQGKGLSPVLLVRNEQHCKVIIADGYHRLCAIYGIDEDAWIRCKII